MNRKNLIILFSLFLTGIFILAVTSARAEIYETYRIYSDAGIPAGSEVWMWDQSDYGGPPADFDGDYPDSTAPEGSKSFRVDNLGNYAGWGVFFPSGTDLSEYFTDSNDIDVINTYLVKFWVKTPVNLKVEIENLAGVKKIRYLDTIYNVKKWDGTNTWQEIWIPIKWFVENPDGSFDVDFLRNLKSPFMITTEASGVTFYVDNVRWVRPVEMPGPSKVEVIGRQLFVNETLFTVKGVCYSPIPVGEYHNYDWSSYPENYGKDFTLLRAMGCNTIRIYKPPTQVEAMDTAYLNGIYVIMDYPISWSSDVSNQATRDNIKNGFLDMVNTWKDHPAVLMWNLGNEMNAHVSSLPDWYSLVNECAQDAHSVDTNHPVTAACQDVVVGGIETQIDIYDSSVGDMDIWSVQVYRGNSFGGLFASFASRSSKPLLLTEFGCDAYNVTIGSEDQDTQSTYIDSQWAEINNNLSSISPSNVSIGGCVFEWSDEWWKHPGGPNSFHDTATDWTNPNYSDPNMNEEWWGIVSVAPDTFHKTQRQAWYTLQSWWRTTPLLTVTLKKISDNTVPAQQLLTWTNVNPGEDEWKAADQYLEVDADTSFSGWGIQIYTDNRNLGGGITPDPPYEGPEETDPCGLIAIDNHTSRIPLCWKITDEVWTTPQDPEEVPDPTISNAYYFSNNYLWMKDRDTPDDPGTPEHLLDEAFVDGEYYVTVWDQDGIQWGGDPSEHGGGMVSPNYIYIGGKFINATTPRIYKTNKLTLEMYFP